MGLYLAIFDGDEEVDGLEVGSYDDFGVFRDTIAAAVEQGKPGSLCPVLMNHADSKGEWSVADAGNLIAELEIIEAAMRIKPPLKFNSKWKEEVAKQFGIRPANLLECFFDVDGESLTGRLRALAETSIARNLPILFQ